MNGLVPLSCRIPDSNNYLELRQDNSAHYIKVAGIDQNLMSDSNPESERQLALRGCRHLKGNRTARILIGGLGMGFTLAAVLQVVHKQATVVVAELVPGIVEWNRGPLAKLAGCPLEDTRVKVNIGDVKTMINSGELWDAIILDCDNGPEAMVHPDNDWLYSMEGLVAAYKRLFTGGVLAIWSNMAYPKFLDQLLSIGFEAEVISLKPEMLYIATKL